MEHFAEAKAVRLRSSHGKYLCADEDVVGVSQERDSGEMSVWEVEMIGEEESGSGAVRLKSAMGGYLTASDEHFLLGMTGKKVVQSLRGNRSLDSLLEWEPIAAGTTESSLIKLKTRHGNFLRGNGGIPPWRNSVTHDVPVRSATQGWLVWEVEVVESKQQQQLERSQVSSLSATAPQLSFKIPKSEGRLIRYAVVWDKKESIPIPSDDWPRFHFQGHTLSDLEDAIRKELALDPSDGMLVYSRHDLSGKIFPLMLALPPNNASMSLVIVRSRQ